MVGKRAVLILATILLLVGWFGNEIYEKLIKNKYYEQQTYQVREDSSRYKYINPLLYTDNSQFIYDELSPLSKEIEVYLNDQITSNKIDTASFYFRDLNTSAWTGVRPDDEYVPASMLKVAVLMAYLRIAEDNPNIINSKLFYKKDPDDTQYYRPSKELTDGYYAVSKLLAQSVVESDNPAAIALASEHITEIDELYKALRLDNPPSKAEDYMSPRDVSRIFRSLYNSTYLLDTYSEQALALLTTTKFYHGLTQGIKDPDIKIAHKFGEHAVYYENSTRNPDYQLHDCGIVYYPGKPYFICVMTKGENRENLEQVIGDISAKTYSFVEENS